MTPQAHRTSTPGRDYLLGYDDTEHDRLIRQAIRIAPITNRFLREAGIGLGQRVLDLGSGMGDVAMAAARAVGPTGEVVGLERDATSIARARARVSAAGFNNLRFMHADLNEAISDERFDAVIGRFVLTFQPDPCAVLRSVARALVPGGVLAFQEVSWMPLVAQGARLPLWSRVIAAFHDTLERSGAHPEMGFDLYRLFQKVGVPAPHMHLDVPLGNDAGFITIVTDALRSARPLANRHRVPLEDLGSLDTLAERVFAEIAAANTVVGLFPIVSAWSRVLG